MAIGQIMAECDCNHVACEMRGYCMADRIEALEVVLEKADEWSDNLAETLQVVNAQHGGRNAARLLKDYRDYKAAYREARK